MRYLKITFSILLLLIINNCCLAQADMKDYTMHWDGKLPNTECFTMQIAVSKINTSTYNFRLSNAAAFLNRRFKLYGNYIEVKIDSAITFKGTLEKGAISGFIESGMFEYHVTLKQTGNTYTTKWKILLVDKIEPRFYLDVEDGAGDNYEAYAFSGDPRFTRFSGFACYDFVKHGNTLLFRDFKTGLAFKGLLSKDAIELNITMAGLPVTKVLLHRSAADWAFDDAPKQVFNPAIPTNIHDELPVNSLVSAGFDNHYLDLMVDSINANKLTNIQSVLISRNGKLVYEQYFDGFDMATTHDMRSASKSISSALIGIAMDKGILKDTSQKLFDFLPEPYKSTANGDTRKQAISIGSLLTMSSGLDAIDFGIDRKSVGSEDEYQQSADWLKTVVNAPMIYQPFTHANYSSANPFLLGVILASQVKQPLELWIDHNLFEPLGITNYIIQRDDKGHPYFGGGMFLQPRDMLKFGLLYANGGKWNNKQIISQKWIDASFKKYLILENHPEKNEYGFLWWHYDYKLNGKTIHSIEARGAGGQYIFIIPEYKIVAVITSANFRNSRVWQPEKVMENYILKAISN
jgi:CubicO group peptidase (beta-lactamase class C family)